MYGLELYNMDEEFIVKRRKSSFDDISKFSTNEIIEELHKRKFSIYDIPCDFNLKIEISTEGSLVMDNIEPSYVVIIHKT